MRGCAKLNILIIIKLCHIYVEHWHIPVMPFRTVILLKRLSNVHVIYIDQLYCVQTSAYGQSLAAA